MEQQLLKRNESGRTMLEMLGVLGIMGIIMYGAIAGINYGMSTYKINQTYNEVQEAIQGIQDLYSWSHCYPQNFSDFTSTVEDNDIFATAQSAFGGSRTVAGIKGGCADSGANTKYSFKITYTGIDQPSCQRLKEMEWGTVVMVSNCASDGADIVFCPKIDNTNGCDD